jgi:hypothetical protein
LRFLKRLFDRKISDKTVTGYNAEEIAEWLSNVEKIDTFKYYYYLPGAKFFTDSKDLKDQPTQEVLSFLHSHFSESSILFTEISTRYSGLEGTK